MSPAPLLRGLLADQRGATIVEFAIVVLPLSLLLMGGFDLGHQSYIKGVMQGALDDAARRASVQDPQLAAKGSTTEERVTNSIKDQLAAITPSAVITVTESNFYDFSGVGNPEKLMTDVNGNGRYDAADRDCFSDLNENGKYDSDTGRAGIGGANDVVFYQAHIVMPRLLPVAKLLGFSPNYDMTVATAFRNQPYATQKTPPVVCGAA
jgi:Flp pilus assembly protein TadG